MLARRMGLTTGDGSPQELRYGNKQVQPRIPPVESDLQQPRGPGEGSVAVGLFIMETPRHMAAVAAPLAVLALSVAALAADPRPSGQGSTVTTNPAPTAEQVQSLIARMIENQHRNDRAIEEYERVEHVVSRKDGENSEVVSDRIEGVLPSGTGTMRLQT